MTARGICILYYMYIYRLRDLSGNVETMSRCVASFHFASRRSVPLRGGTISARRDAIENYSTSLRFSAQGRLIGIDSSTELPALQGFLLSIRFRSILLLVLIRSLGSTGLFEIEVFRFEASSRASSMQVRLEGHRKPPRFDERTDAGR